MLRQSFQAMGTEVELLVEADDEPIGRAALLAAKHEVLRLESVLSRFLADSELSRLNRGGRLHAGSDLLRVVEAAMAARERSGGRVDPTVHDSLLAAGYDRTFAQLQADVAPAPADPPRGGGEVWINRQRSIVELGAGVRLDLGGIAKGDAAERACERLAAAGPCLASIGGDLAVRGVPEAGSWHVGVDTPAGPLTLALTAGGLATSGRDRRQWRQGGEARHHVIDPATGLPAETDLVRVTAVASDAVEAEVLAKSLLIAGRREALAQADEQGTPCVLVGEHGEVVLAGGLG
jgi:thiamine biosynthesis lipoprotein